MRPDECDHEEFENRHCTTCGIKCEHWNVDDRITFYKCLDCGDLIVKERDWMEEAHAEMEDM